MKISKVPKKVIQKKLAHLVDKKRQTAPPQATPIRSRKRICIRKAKTIKPKQEEHPKNLNWQVIEKIFYINLETRRDRDAEMQNQFKLLNIPPEKIERIDAVYKEFGAIGCTQSHIKALERAKSLELKNFLVLEDDFNFNLDNLAENLNHLEKINFKWDVIMFSLNKNIPQSRAPFYKVDRARTTSGYLVNGHYIDTLLENYKTGLLNLQKTQSKSRYAIDVWFMPLQSSHKWYTFTKRGGYQRPSYSDIEKRHVNYKC